MVLVVFLGMFPTGRFQFSEIIVKLTIRRAMLLTAVIAMLLPLVFGATRDKRKIEHYVLSTHATAHPRSKIKTVIRADVLYFCLARCRITRSTESGSAIAYDEDWLYLYGYLIKVSGKKNVARMSS